MVLQTMVTLKHCKHPVACKLHGDHTCTLDPSSYASVLQALPTTHSSIASPSCLRCEVASCFYEISVCPRQDGRIIPQIPPVVGHDTCMHPHRALVAARGRHADVRGTAETLLGRQPAMPASRQMPCSSVYVVERLRTVDLILHVSQLSVHGCAQRSLGGQHEPLDLAQ